jgi:MFS family permease
MSSALAARLPQGMSSLAILLLVRGATHSYAAAGVAVGAFAFASAGCAPFFGRLVDRFGRARVLVPTALGQAVLFVALALAARDGTGAAPLIVLSALAGALLPPIAPVMRALLRVVFVDSAVRETAYSLDAVTQELVWIVGPLLVAVIITAISAEGAVALLGAVCISGTALFVRSPTLRNAPLPRFGPGRGSALADPQLRAMLVPIALNGTGIGAVEVGLPSLALHAGSGPASGLLLALWSAGSLTGGLWYGSRAWRSPLASRYRRLLMLAVICTAPLIVARSILAGAVCSVLAGLTIAPVFSCQYALIGRSVTPGTETEAFTWVTAALVGGLAAGSAIGGVAIGAAGESAPFVIACAATLLAAGMAVGLRGRVSGRSLPSLGNAETIGQQLDGGALDQGRDDHREEHEVEEIQAPLYVVDDREGREHDRDAAA